MRNGIVHVQQIEIFVFSYCRHLRCQRQRVGLMLEQRIRHHLDFMKSHPLIQFSQARGQRGRDEMNGMAALRKLFPQLRTDDAAAAVSWIDCDSDVHERLKSMQSADSPKQLSMRQ